MIRARGFTLVEVAIVLAILAVMSFPAMEMFEQVGRQHRRALAISDLKTSCTRALSHLSAFSSKIQIDQDQRGATLPQGKLQWRGETLTLTRDGHSTTLLSGVRHASLFRRDGAVYLTLEVASPDSKAYQYRTISNLGAPR